MSIVDRASKLVKLIKVQSREKKIVCDALIKRLGRKKVCAHTITSDNVKEFADHARVASVLNARFYFAKPYHLWDHGLNEHSNGLVRQYFPKGISFDILSNKVLRAVENKLNSRPRKCLNFSTRLEVFFRLFNFEIFALQT